MRNKKLEPQYILLILIALFAIILVTQWSSIESFIKNVTGTDQQQPRDENEQNEQVTPVLEEDDASEETDSIIEDDRPTPEEEQQPEDSENIPTAPTPKPTPTPQPEPQTSNWWEYPDEILPVTKSGNDLLVLVNKKYKLPSSYAPSDLTRLTAMPGLRVTKEMYVRSIILDDLKSLATAAKAAGLDLSAVSGYRSYSTQASTYQYWVNYNGGNVAAADTVSARPGHSQHQLGTTVDFSSSEVGDQIGSVFNSTTAATWLANNAWKYGFVLAYPGGAEEITGYSYESWHYRYIGVENAKAWKQSGKVLDVWLQGV